MRLTAIFESWHIGDGNYPPLTKGQIVCLSFELECERLAYRPIPDAPHVGLGREAECRGMGRILRSYGSDGEALVVIEAGDFRFYVHGTKATSLKVGDLVDFEGTLLLDHYLWVEFLDRYADPPDLFYNLRVTRIRRVGIPERCISRHERGRSYPTRVGPGESQDVVDLETMEGQSFEEEFYIIDFDDAGLEGERFARTFGDFRDPAHRPMISLPPPSCPSGALPASVAITDPKLKAHVARVVTLMTDLPEDQLICGLMDAYQSFARLEGDHSPRVAEAFRLLLCEELRPALRAWYRTAGATLNPHAIESPRDSGLWPGRSLACEPCGLFRSVRQAGMVRMMRDPAEDLEGGGGDGHAVAR